MYLPRVFTSTIVTAAYISPDANAKLAMKELHAAVSKQQTLQPAAAFLVAGDFNLQLHSPNSTCLLPDERRLDFGPSVHTTHQTCDTHSEEGRFKFGQRDQTGVRLPLRPPWTPTLTLILMPPPFWTSSTPMSTVSLRSLIRRMNREVRLRQKTRHTAFRSGDAQAYSSSRANLKRGIKKAKHSHKIRTEEHVKNNSDPRRMWHPGHHG